MDTSQDNLLKIIEDHKNLRMKGLLKSLIKRDVIYSESVCRAMMKVDRGEFCDSDYAYMDMYSL
jgi:hypothetical protein